MRAALAILLLGLAVHSARLGVAGYLARAGRTSLAGAIDPRNALYPLLSARQAEENGVNPIEFFQRAVELSPYDASLRMRLGLAEERAGRLETAEREMLEAARLSRKYDPRWTLANFYFRRHRNEEFWRWTRDALEVSSINQPALFDLCWSVSRDGAEIQRRALPAQRAPRIWYAHYLASHRRLDALEPVVMDLAADAQVAESPFFRGMGQALLGDYRVNAAARIAVVVNARGLVEADPFGWEAPRTEGVTAMPERESGWRLTFSGRQPERAVLLSRIAQVEPDRPQLFVWTGHTSLTTPAGLPAATGLYWRVAAYTRQGSELARSAPFSAQGIQSGALAYRVGSGVAAVWIQLVCERPAGVMRVEGSATITIPR